MIQARQCFVVAQKCKDAAQNMSLNHQCEDVVCMRINVLALETKCKKKDAADRAFMSYN